MEVTNKPILHNGFVVQDDIAVLRRVERVYFSDVYELSDSTFLYLFLNLSPNEISDTRGRYNVVRIEKDGKEWLGVILKKHTVPQVGEVIENLTTVRGFDCIAGMRDLKTLLYNEVIHPLTNPEKFERFKVSIPNGILLYGPPGVGKSFIVRKLAEELGFNYMEVKGSDLATPYIHGSVGNIGKVFSEARKSAPTILCFNEISALVPDRKSLSENSSHKEEETSEFLTQLEEAADNKILVIGTTNFVERIDEAVLRPGRFDKKIHVPPPDEEARIELFKIGLSGRPFAENVDFKKLATLTEGYSSADIIEGVVETAARNAVNLNKDEIDQDLLEQEIAKLKPVEEERPKIGFNAA